MSFTLHIELADYGERPVPDVEFSVVAMASCLPQLSYVGTTDAEGVVDIEVLSIPGVTWVAHSTGRGSFSFIDPGDDVTVNLASVFQLA